MARTSRAKKRNTPLRVLSERVYKVGLYVRLSVLDSGKKDSDTVEVQESLLRGYIKDKAQFALVDIYVDNGQSGVNFKRDEFERLLDDVKVRKIDCIIVKDLSRFGRNYIEAGEYLEKVFPFLGVRFIAVNDNYDSINPASADSMSLHLKNLINDVYARDISAKVTPVLRGKQERGEFIGSWAPYGYQKSPQDKHKLIIDEVSAPIVRDIFAWRLEGMGTISIARRLTEMNVPTPAQHRYNKGTTKNENYKKATWSSSAIKQILTKEVYLGKMVQGCHKNSLSEGKKRIKRPRNEWIVVENTHEAIITQETFDIVQRLLQQKNEEFQSMQGRYAKTDGSDYILKGLLYCGDCGRHLQRYKKPKGLFRKAGENIEEDLHREVWYRYICRIHALDPARCRFLQIGESAVFDAVFTAIQCQIAVAADMEKLVRRAAAKPHVQTEKEKIGQQIQQAEELLQRTTRHRERLYDDYADRLMNEQDYVYAQARYQKKELELKRQLSELNSIYLTTQEEKDEDNPWLTSMLRFRGEQKLTREMATTLIEKITVYDKQTLHIDFRFQDDFKRLQEHLNGESEARCG